MWKPATFRNSCTGLAYLLLVSVAHCDPNHISNLRGQRQAKADNRTVTTFNIPVPTLVAQTPIAGPTISSTPKDSSEEDRTPPPNNVEDFLFKQTENVGNLWLKFTGNVKETAVSGAYRTKENFLKGITLIGEGVNFWKTITGSSSMENGKVGGGGCDDKNRTCTTTTSTPLSSRVPEDVDEEEGEENKDTGQGENEESGEEVESQESADEPVATEDVQKKRKRRNEHLSKIPYN